jgi:6-phosphogluconolactonase
MLTFLLAFVSLLSMTNASSSPSPIPFYVGTYTGPNQGQGVYFVTFDPATSALSKPVLAAKADQASFLAMHPTLPVLYAVSENYGSRSGKLLAFTMNADHSLSPLSSASTQGDGPCYVHASGNAVAVAHYGSGSLGWFKLDQKGAIVEPVTLVKHEGRSVNESRQKAPHAHAVVFSPCGKWALACDLGTDEVIVYQVEGAAWVRSSVAKATPGAGPRHLAFTPDGKFVVVVNELNNTVVSYAWGEGTLTQVGSSPTLPADFTGESSTAEVAVHPNGKWVYVSNRGHDSIAVLSIDQGQLKLLDTTPTQGAKPRHFAIDPSGRFLMAANQGSNTLVVFVIDATTGRLSPAGASVEVPAPVCVRFVR